MKLVIVVLISSAAALASALPPPEDTAKVAAKAAAGQSLVCYNSADCTGNSITVSQDVYDLKSLSYDNKISCCVFNGIWILYQDPYFNTALGPQAGIVYSWGDNKKGQMPTEFDNQASSLRFAGDVKNYRNDSLNLYSKEHFTADAQYAFTDQPKLAYVNFGRSAIVTGCTPWTLYTQVNYGGSSVCLLPGDAIDCLPRVYPDFTGFENMNDRVSSVRRGCFSSTKMMGLATRELDYAPKML